MTHHIDVDAFLEELFLKEGGHKTPDDGMCAMEAVAFIAGEKHSDSPSCASPVIAAFMRRWNDDLDDAGRQALKPWLPRLVGTRSSSAVETARAWMCTDWLIHNHLPTWLRLAGMEDQAVAVEALPLFDSRDVYRAHRPLLEEIRAAGLKRYEEARARLIDIMKSHLAAGAAEAAEIARTYREHGYSAAYGKARELIKPIARKAVEDQLGDKLPSLQQSAFELLDRMIAAGGPVDVHNMPETSSDARMHVIDRTCWCGPELVEADGTTTVVHHAESDIEANA